MDKPKNVYSDLEKVPCVGHSSQGYGVTAMKMMFFIQYRVLGPTR